MIRVFVAGAMAVAMSACAARVPPRPVAAAAADPSALTAFAAATAGCRGLTTLSAELALSGRAAGERISGRVHAGLEATGAVRLEGVAPFGPPIFILGGRHERAVLLLPRERRVLGDTAVADVLERLTGLALGADDLRFMLSGCLADQVAPTDGRSWPGGWQGVSLGPDRAAYVRTRQGQPVVVAADYGPWRIDYAEHQGGYPRLVRIRRTEGTDITARIGQLSVNTPIDSRAFDLEIPADYAPLTLDELRSAAPLAPREE